MSGRAKTTETISELDSRVAPAHRQTSFAGAACSRHMKNAYEKSHERTSSVCHGGYRCHGSNTDVSRNTIDQREDGRGEKGRTIEFCSCLAVTHRAPPSPQPKSHKYLAGARAVRSNSHTGCSWLGRLQTRFAQAVIPPLVFHQFF
jgi:hypothetical protein